jgi:hypothetical protein
MNKTILMVLAVLVVAGLGAAAVFLGPRLFGPSFQDATPVGPISRVETVADFTEGGEEVHALDGETLWVVHIAGKWQSSDDLMFISKQAQAAVLVDDAESPHPLEKWVGHVNGADIDVVLVFGLPLKRKGYYLRWGEAAVKLPAR